MFFPCLLVLEFFFEIEKFQHVQLKENLCNVFTDFTYLLVQTMETRSSQRRWSVKKLFLEISQNSQENTCARDSFLIILQNTFFQNIFGQLLLENQRNSHINMLKLILKNHNMTQSVQNVSQVSLEEFIFRKTPWYRLKRRRKLGCIAGTFEKICPHFKRSIFKPE